MVITCLFCKLAAIGSVFDGLLSVKCWNLRLGVSKRMLGSISNLFVRCNRSSYWVKYGSQHVFLYYSVAVAAASEYILVVWAIRTVFMFFCSRRKDLTEKKRKLNNAIVNELRKQTRKRQMRPVPKGLPQWSGWARLANKLEFYLCKNWSSRLHQWPVLLWKLCSYVSWSCRPLFTYMRLYLVSGQFQ